MQYESVRDRIVTLVKSVTGIGKVFPHLRLSTDLEQFINLFTVIHPGDPTKMIPSVAFITRQNTVETALRAENEFVVGVNSAETYRITLLYGFQDDDDPVVASDAHFQALLDRIAEAFRFADPTTFAAEAVRVNPASILSAGIFSQELGGYLCHKAEIEVRVEMYINS